MSLSPELAARLLAEHPDEAKVAWRPAPCFYCSGAIVDGQLEPHVNTIRGTGRDPFDPSKPCPECVKRNHPAAFGYGPQGVALLKKDFEILMSGVKRSGKTETATVWMVRGNPDEPEYDKHGQPILVNWSYVHHPDFRGLVIRKDLKDLTDWRTFAEPYYAGTSPPLELVGDQFICKSTGARIYIGHLHDSSSWQRIQGARKLHRVWIDEATHIADPGLYYQVMSCLSTTDALLRCQIMLTTNWIGPGVGWVRARFLESKDYRGEPAKPFHSTVELVEVKGTRSYRSRIFIHTGIQDNPHVREYYQTLAMIPDEKMKRVYLEGDPYAMEGNFFDAFRPKGPQAGEPENADHVIPRWAPKGDPEKNRRAERRWNPHHRLNRETGLPDLPGWWSRAIGGDWGFRPHEASFHWACRNPDSEQTILYREYMAQADTPRLVGAEIARRTAPDLEKMPGNAITMYFSHDAFAQRGTDDGLTIVELIQQGIQKILGPNSVWVPELELKRLEETAGDQLHPGFHESLKEYREQVLTQRRMGITIRMARNTSKGLHSWQVIREAMAWRSTDPGRQQFSKETYFRIQLEAGIEAASEYAAQFQRREPVMPQLQIVEDACPRLIEALPKLVHQDATKIGNNPEMPDKTHFPGRDAIESFVYLVNGFREQSADQPAEERREEFIVRMRQQQPAITTHGLIQVMRQWEAKEAENRRSPILRVATPAGRTRERRRWLRQGRIA